MAVLDWIFLFVLMASMLLGAWRGLIYELMSVFGWVLAFVLAQWLGDEAGALLPIGESSETLRFMAGFVLIFLMTVFSFGFMAWLLKRMVESAGLRPVDRVLGGLFGLLRGAILIVLFGMAVLMTSLRQGAWWQHSVGGPATTIVINGVRHLMPYELSKHLP